MKRIIYKKYRHGRKKGGQRYWIGRKRRIKKKARRMDKLIYDHDTGEVIGYYNARGEAILKKKSEPSRLTEPLRKSQMVIFDEETGRSKVVPTKKFFDRLKELAEKND